ncbi:MAG: YncE family protein, partial [Terriglobia bacterium]
RSQTAATTAVVTQTLYWAQQPTVRKTLTVATSLLPLMSARRQFEFSMQNGPRYTRALALLLGPALVLLFSACARRMAPPKPYLALIADHGAQSAAVFDLAQFDIVKMIPLGFAPARLRLRPLSQDVYVTSETGRIAVIRFPQLAVIRNLQFGRGPNDVVFLPEGREAFILERGRRSVFKIDCDSGRTVDTFKLPSPAAAIALTPDGKTLLAEDPAAGKLLFLDSKNGKVLGSAATGGGATPLVILPDGQKAFVAVSGSNEVVAVALADHQVLSRIEVGSPPSFLALKPDGGEIFALSAADSTLTILDAFHDSVEQSMTAGAQPVAAVFSRDSALLYIANAGDGTVTQLDVATRGVKSLVHVGMRLSALALTPDERFLAVTDAGGESVSVVRTATGDLITTKPAGQDPVDVIIPGWLGR